MGKDKTQRVVTVDTPGMTHVVTREYFQIWGTDVMVSRKFFKWWTLMLMLLFGAGTYVATRVFTLDIIAWQWFTLNLWVLIPGGAILAGTLYIWRWSITQEVRKREREAAKLITYANKYIDKNLPEQKDVEGSRVRR